MSRDPRGLVVVVLGTLVLALVWIVAAFVMGVAERIGQVFP